MARKSRFPINGTVGIFVALLVAWQIISLFYHATAFPSLLEVGEALGTIFNGTARYTFWEHVPITVARIFMSVAFAMMIGVPIGIVMGSNSDTTEFFRFFLLIVLVVPSVMWAFVTVTWFGVTTYLVPVSATVLALLPYVIINIWKGTESVDSTLLEMGQVFEISKTSIWYNIYYPHLLPFLFSTTRMLFSLGWRIMLVAELFGAQSGMGFIINGYFLSSENNMMLAWSIPIFLLMFSLERGLQRIEKRKFAWRDGATENQSAGV